MEIALLEGRPEDALGLADDVDRDGVPMPDLAGVRVVGMAMLGRFGEALERLGEPLSVEPRLRLRHACYAAWLEAVRGDVERARQHLRDATRDGVSGSDAIRWYRFAERAISRHVA